MDVLRIDWKLAAAVAFVTFLVLTSAAGDGLDVQPIWALLGGFAAALGIAFARRPITPGGR